MLPVENPICREHGAEREREGGKTQREKIKERVIGKNGTRKRRERERERK